MRSQKMPYIAKKGNRVQDAHTVYSVTDQHIYCMWCIICNMKHAILRIIMMMSMVKCWNISVRSVSCACCVRGISGRRCLTCLR